MVNKMFFVLALFFFIIALYQLGISMNQISNDEASAIVVACVFSFFLSGCFTWLGIKSKQGKGLTEPLLSGDSSP